MARYIGPATRISRRLRVDLVGGDLAFERRPYPPGHAGRNRIKESEYLLQLQEKQKAKYTYGVLERQFRRYYTEANRLNGKTGDNLVILLESRLDNVVYRAGLAKTRRQARQLVSHGHFTVNGKNIDIPSYSVTQYDIIDVAHVRRRCSASKKPRTPWPTPSFRLGCRLFLKPCASSCTSCPSALRSTFRCKNSSSSSFTRSNPASYPQLFFPYCCPNRRQIAGAKGENSCLFHSVPS